MKIALIAVALACWSASFSVLAEEAYQPFPVVAPTRLHFVASNVFGGGIYVDLNQGALAVHRTEVDKTSSNKTVQPSAKAWRKFIHVLNKAKMYEWAPYYENRDAVDGGGWEIKMTVGQAYLYSRGLNAFPRDAALYLPAENKDTSKSFKAFWTALCELIGEDASRFPL